MTNSIASIFFNGYRLTGEEVETCRIVSNQNWIEEIPKEIKGSLINQLREGDKKITYPRFQEIIRLFKEKDSGIKTLYEGVPSFNDIIYLGHGIGIIYHIPHTLGERGLLALELKVASEKSLFEFASKFGLLGILM